MANDCFLTGLLTGHITKRMDEWSHLRLSRVPTSTKTFSPYLSSPCPSAPTASTRPSSLFKPARHSTRAAYTTRLSSSPGTLTWSPSMMAFTWSFVQRNDLSGSVSWNRTAQFGLEEENEKANEQDLVFRIDLDLRWWTGCRRVLFRNEKMKPSSRLHWSWLQPTYAEGLEWLKTTRDIKTGSFEVSWL